MKRGLALLALLFVFSTISSVYADGSWTVDLVAGQNTTIGTVNFAISGDTLNATFTVTSPGWCLETTHFYAGNVAPGGIAPGRFQYQHENLGCVTADSYSVPVPDGDVFVAAHADSEFGTTDSENQEPIGDTGTMTVTGGSNSYFDASIDVAGLAANYSAWCVDLGHYISTGVNYEVDVFETGDALVDKPGNLDLILYIINQDYTTIGASAYDIQVAIWFLIDDITPITNLISLAIIEDAIANGEGFSPGCGQLTGVFMDAGPDVQNIMVVIPAPCETSGEARGETAWALADWGIEFGQGWGMYFQLVDAPDPVPTDEPPPVPSEEPPAPAPDIVDNDNGNRARNDEAPGTSPDNSAPGDRSDESRGNNNNNGNNNSSNSNGNGNGRGN